MSKTLHDMLECMAVERYAVITLR